LLLFLKQYYSNNTIYLYFNNSKTLRIERALAHIERKLIMTIKSSPTAAGSQILEISASGRRGQSVSRMLTQEVIDAIQTRDGDIALVRRDLADGVGFVDEDWIGANFADPEARSPKQHARLAESDKLVAELQAADTIVIGMPIYNFGIPAALKAWIDMIARARLTFRYTSTGPEGLLRDKHAIVVVASGGVRVDSRADHATPYLRQALGFVGITDIEIVAADQLNKHAEESIDKARLQISELIHRTGRIDGRAA
jgi:FMN-dependent NADH-azoreductase